MAQRKTSEPFRILDYAETAEQLAAAAAELNGLVVEVHGVIRSDLAVVEDAARSTVDHLVFRAAELVLVILAAAFVLRAFWNRTRTAPQVD